MSTPPRSRSNEGTEDKWWLSGWRSRTLPVLGALVLWEAVARSGMVNAHLFPPPSAALLAFRDWAVSGDLWLDLETSLIRMLAGLAIGAVLGVATGMFTGSLRWAAALLAPVLQALRPVPPVAIIPLVIVWFGIGNPAKIFAISFAVFFPVWLNSHLGAAAIPREYRWSARILTSSRWRTFFRVTIPAALPAIFAGVRNGIAVAFIMVYVSEIAGASAGLGYRISIAHLAYRIDLMVAALATLAVAGALTDLTFAFAVSRLCPWMKLSER
jgi:ABC-type nitrate/sulfonate/bicarbonate transport system permease component